MATAVKFPGPSRLLVTAASLAALAGVATGPAHAEPDPVPADESGTPKDPNVGKKAKQAFRKGQRLFAMGKFRQALTSYKRAYELTDLPEILFNMAQCYRNLGDYQSAVVHFRDYLERKPDADNRDAVRTLIERLEEEMAEADRHRKPPPRSKSKPKPKPRPTPIDGGKKPVERPGTDESDSPIYTRWWFWAGLVAIAGASGAYVLYGRDGGVPSSDLGNIDFPP